MLHGVLVIDSKTGALLYAQRFSPAYGLAGCEHVAGDDIRLSAMLFALYLHSANVADDTSQFIPRLVQHSIGSTSLHFCTDGQRQMLVVLAADAVLGGVYSSFLAQQILDKFVHCFETLLETRLTSGKRTRFGKQEFGPALLDAILSVPPFILSTLAAANGRVELLACNALHVTRTSGRSGSGSRSAAAVATAPAECRQPYSIEHVAVLYSKESFGSYIVPGTVFGRAESAPVSRGHRIHPRHAESINSDGKQEAMASTTTRSKSRWLGFHRWHRMVSCRYRFLGARFVRNSPARTAPRPAAGTHQREVFFQLTQPDDPKHGTRDICHRQLLHELRTALRASHGSSLENDAVCILPAEAHTHAEGTPLSIVLILRPPMCLRVAVQHNEGCGSGDQDAATWTARSVHEHLEPLRLFLMTVGGKFQPRRLQ